MSRIFLNVNSLNDLLKLKDKYGKKAALVAGGTDIVPRIKEGITDPEVLIGIRNLDEMKSVQIEKDRIIIGAATSISEIENSPVIRDEFYPLYEAAFNMASPQIRNMATIGGNIANCSPSGDTIPPLVLMEGEVKLHSAGGEREVPVLDFMSGPGCNLLDDGEIIHSFIIKRNGYSSENSGYFKVGKRNALAISVVSMAYRKKDDEAIYSFGGASPRIRRVKVALSADKSEIDEIIGASVNPIDDIRASAEYRRRVIGNIVKSIHFGEE